MLFQILEFSVPEHLVVGPGGAPSATPTPKFYKT